MRLSPEQIRVAVADPKWQKFRLSLKGRSTEAKLVELKEYLEQGMNTDEEHEVMVRVQNYLNALSRGGQIAPANLSALLSEQIATARILK